MSSDITIYDTQSINHTITATSINIAVANNLAYYTHTDNVTYVVDYLRAEFENGDDTLTINASGTNIYINGIRASANGEDVDSMISWVTSGNPVTAIIVSITCPANAREEMEWSIGEGIPPVKLKVKIARK